MNELLNKIYDTLKSNGFNDDYVKKAFPIGHKDLLSGFGMTKDDKGSYDSKKHMNGYDIYTRPVYRHNGTSENVSVDVCIHKFKDSMGQNIETDKITKVRIKSSDSDKVFNKRIATILNSWEDITK